jgi:hypothetical protein
MVFVNFGDHAFIKEALDPGSLAFVLSHMEKIKDGFLRQMLYMVP